MVLHEARKVSSTSALIFPLISAQPFESVNVTLLYKSLIACDYIFIAPLLCSEDQDEYLCNDGQCISLSLRCNGNPDCSNGEDEQNCRKFNCFYKIARMFFAFAVSLFHRCIDKNTMKNVQ